MDNLELSKNEKNLFGLAVIFGVFGILMLSISIFYFNNAEVYDSSLKIDSGKFGDFGSFISGVVGTVWSLVSVILFYLTFSLQRKELSLQRTELELTRNELQGQKDQMIQQNKTLLQQQFESTFFQLMSVHTSIVSSMDLRSMQDKGSVISEGRDCFQIFYRRLRSSIMVQRIDGKDVRFDAKEASSDDTVNGYNAFYDKEQNSLGHYFRNLYHIIKFIDNSDIESKKTYSSFVRAQLSSHELALLFYNCLSIHGKKFKPLIEKYALLKNMNPELVYNQQHLNEYENSAYGK